MSNELDKRESSELDSFKIQDDIAVSYRHKSIHLSVSPELVEIEKIRADAIKSKVDASIKIAQEQAEASIQIANAQYVESEKEKSKRVIKKTWIQSISEFLVVVLVLSAIVVMAILAYQKLDGENLAKVFGYVLGSLTLLFIGYKYFNKKIKELEINSNK